MCPKCIACPQTLFYLVTTGIDVDKSVQDPAVVGLNWTYMSSGMIIQFFSVDDTTRMILYKRRKSSDVDYVGLHCSVFAQLTNSFDF